MDSCERGVAHAGGAQATLAVSRRSSAAQGAYVTDVGLERRAEGGLVEFRIVAEDEDGVARSKPPACDCILGPSDDHIGGS